MADYPSDIWIREPVIDGRLVGGGGLNRAMALLGQARGEIAAIETELGTDVAGSKTDLVSRLDVRLSPSGIGRGRVYPLRPPNATAGTYEDASSWFKHTAGPVPVQFGYSGPYVSVHEQTITYGTAYSVAPDFVIAKFVSASRYCGQVQVSSGSIGTTTFKIAAKAFDSSRAWTTPANNFYVLWAAFGGS